MKRLHYTNLHSLGILEERADVQVAPVSIEENEPVPAPKKATVIFDDICIMFCHITY